jgi:hypothetical protein
VGSDENVSELARDMQLTFTEKEKSAEPPHHQIDQQDDRSGTD